MKDVPLVLYRLPEVLDAIEQHRVVYLVEGEKSVHALEALGETATALSGGSKTSNTTAGLAALDALAGAGEVRIIADRDEPGTEDAQRKATHLEMLGVPCTTWRSATDGKGDDIVEHLAASHTLEDLEPCDASPVGEDMLGLDSESWSEFRDRSAADVPMLVSGLMPEGALGFLAAPPKAGKTWLALNLALCVATGQPYLGRFVVPKRRSVLYLALEGDRAAIRARIAALARGLGIDPNGDELDGWLRIAYKPAGINISDPAWTDRVLADADRLDAGLVVVDVLRAAAPHLPESGEGATAFAQIRQNLAPLATNGRAVLLLHHFVKFTDGTKDRPLGDRMSGSGALFGAADVLMAITQSQDKGRRMRFEVVGRDIVELDPLGLTLDGQGSGEHGGITHSDTAVIVASDEVPDAPSGIKKGRPEAIAEVVRSQPTQRASSGVICDALGIVPNTLKNRREALISHNIHYTGGTRGAEYFYLDPATRNTPQCGLRGLTDPRIPQPATPIRDAGWDAESDGSIDEATLDLLATALVLASEQHWRPIKRGDELYITQGEAGWTTFGGHVEAGHADAIAFLPQLVEALQAAAPASRGNDALTRGSEEAT